MVFTEDDAIRIATVREFPECVCERCVVRFWSDQNDSHGVGIHSARPSGRPRAVRSSDSATRAATCRMRDILLFRKCDRQTDCTGENQAQCPDDMYPD